MCRKLEIYGDSILRGVTYDSAKGRYVLCRERSETIEKLGVEARNYSRLGATVTKGVELIERNVTENEKGTVVLLAYGGNDCDFDWKQVSEDPQGKYSPNTSDDEFRSSYHRMIDRIVGAGAKPVIATLVPLDAERFMKWISRGLSYENILRWLGDVNKLALWQERYNRILESVAEERSVTLLNIRSAFLTSPDIQALLCADGIHPSADGHRIINEQIRGLVRE